MFDDKDFTLAARYETTGGFGELGVRILITNFFGMTLDKADIAIADAHCESMIREIQARRVRDDPDTAAKASTTRNQLVACFPSGMPIYVEQIPNEYWGRDPYGFASPWLIVTTPRGRIKLGWRKRVISIDWSGSDIKETANDLFPNENVTKIDWLIHAWGYEKAKAYLWQLLVANTTP